MTDSCTSPSFYYPCLNREERAPVSLPVIVSPYLRPFLHDGALRIDNGMLGRVHSVDPLECEIVRALWDGDASADQLDPIAEREGVEVLSRAIESLLAQGILFGSHKQCDEAFDRALVSGCPEVPFLDQVELTNVCPMRCRFCPRGVPGRMTRPTGFMDLELYVRLLDQAHPQQRNYRPLELHHLGESLLHPEVDRFVAEATRRGLPTEMSVNPSLLEPTLGRSIIDAGIRRMVISLDAMDDETLMAIRGPAAQYRKAEANLRALLEYASSKRGPPQIVIQMLDLHRNRHQRDAFMTRWANTGLSFVHAYVKDLDGPDPDLAAPTSSELVYLCIYPWRSVVVLWDGSVAACCRDHDALLVLGRIGETALRQIWHGERVRQLREVHQGMQAPPEHLCTGCAWRRQRFAAAMPQRHPDRAVANPLQW